MGRTLIAQGDARQRVVQAVLGLIGLGYILAALALLLAPVWFFQNIGPYSPFNRHYEGDAGAFLLALGGGLLVAARDPARHAALIGVAAWGSVLHAANHIYDSLAGGASIGHWLTDTLPLVAAGLVLVAVWLPLVRRELPGSQGR